MLAGFAALSGEKAVPLDFGSDSHSAFFDWLRSLNLRFASNANRFALRYFRG
jgi:hypothetical protein